MNQRVIGAYLAERGVWHEFGWSRGGPSIKFYVKIKSFPTAHYAHLPIDDEQDIKFAKFIVDTIRKGEDVPQAPQPAPQSGNQPRRSPLASLFARLQGVWRALCARGKPGR